MNKLKLCFIALIIIGSFMLGSDFLSVIKMKESEEMLQSIREKKEKILAKKMEMSPQQTQTNQLVLLNRTKACFTIVSLCDASKTWLTKIQTEKPKAKTTQNTFQISLELMSNYAAFVTFMDKLNQLPWKMDCKTLNITSKNSKKAKLTTKYPLQIKLKLAISNYALSTNPLASGLNNTLNSEDSPFLIKRYTGKLFYNHQTFNIISLESVDKQNILRIAKPVLN